MPDYGKCSAISGSPEADADRVYRFLQAGAPEWFAIAVKPRSDKVVARTLETKGFETFLPLYTKRHQYATCWKKSALPLFPGYVFCRFDAQTRLPILITPGVIRILGTGHRPIPLPETEIASLRTAIRAQFDLQPIPFLQVGEKVRINRGVLTGVEGIIMNFKQCLRLVLSITLLQRSVLLEIDRDQVSAERVVEPRRAA